MSENFDWRKTLFQINVKFTPAESHFLDPRRRRARIELELSNKGWHTNKELELPDPEGPVTCDN